MDHTPFRVTVVTLFPNFFVSPLNQSILYRGTSAGLVEFQVIDIRDFAFDKHHVTDDRPYGGGPGMVMKVEPIYEALKSLDLVDKTGLKPMAQRPKKTQVILTSARGAVFSQVTAKQLVENQEVVFICGHYEGVDQRVADHLVDLELRIGDYVLTGGEAAALVMADAVTRLVPGVLGNEASLNDESHDVPGVLGYPQYTRPAEFNGWQVPEALQSGHHELIARWRQAQRHVDDTMQ